MFASSRRFSFHQGFTNIDLDLCDLGEGETKFRNRKSEVVDGEISEIFMGPTGFRGARSKREVEVALGYENGKVGAETGGLRLLKQRQFGACRGGESSAGAVNVGSTYFVT